MSQQLASRLESFFTNRAVGDLRSIVKYEESTYEITYLREDIREQYSEEEIEEAVDDSRMESVIAPTYDEFFSDDHGDLVCLTKYFEDVVEMNFVIDDGIGATVGLDEDILDETSGLLADARDIVNEEQ